MHASGGYHEGVLELEGRGLGNQVLRALAESVGRMELHTLNVAGNRATDGGLKPLLAELTKDSVRVRTLNLPLVHP